MIVRATTWTWSAVGFSLALMVASAGLGGLLGWAAKSPRAARILVGVLIASVLGAGIAFADGETIITTCGGWWRLCF